MAAALKIEDLTCRYGSVDAVKSVTLAVRPGELFTLLGPSGCGKSTILRAIGGFIRPDSGRVVLDEQDITSLPPAKRPTNYVFQNYALFPHLTVAQNVEYGLKRRRVPGEQRRRRVAAELARVGMAALGGRRPATLSGGQQQRVALARALINLPQVLLLDEPLSALDYTMRRQLRQEIKGIQRDVGITTLFVTHDQGEALSMADRIAVMSGGAIEQVGIPAEIYERPVNRFVATFIGNANLLRGWIAEADACSRFVRLDAGGELRLESIAGAKGEPCHVMIRPEAMEVSAPSVIAPEGRCSIAACLLDVTYGGDHTECRFRLNDGTIATARLRVSSAQIDTDCRLSWAASAVHLIAAEREPSRASVHRA